MAGGGKSSQTQQSTFTDNRAALGQDSLYANNGATVTSYTVDPAVVARALDTVDNGTGAAFDFGAGALSSVSEAVRQVLNFGSDSQARAFGTVADATAMAQNTARDALARALSFGGDALSANQHNVDRVLDATTQTQHLVADAYNDAKGRGAMTDKLLMAALAALGLIAFAAVKK